MGNTLADIRRVLPALEMAFQAEQLRMSKITSRIDRLTQQIRDIDQPRDAGTDLSPVAKAGADLRWKTWVQQRKALINQELARAYQQREGVRVNMVSALAKLEAAKQVEAKAALAASRLAERRSSW